MDKRMKRMGNRGWRAVRLLFGVALLAGGACQGAEKPATPPPVISHKEGGTAMAFQLSSTAFDQGSYVPKKYTGDGANVSPALRWTDPPTGTQSFALICDDPDAPVGTWVHWVAWGIPAAARELPEAVAPQKVLDNGIKQGTNDFRKIGYGGPAPPPGSDHRYFFKLYALDTPLNLNPGAAKENLVNAMKGHILAEAQWTGRYKR